MRSSPSGGGVNKRVSVDGVIVVGVGEGKSRGRGTTVLRGDIDTRDVTPWRWCEGGNGGVGRKRPCHGRARSGARPGREVVVGRFHGRGRNIDTSSATAAKNKFVARVP